MAAEAEFNHYNPREAAQIERCLKALKSVKRILVEPGDSPCEYHLVEENEMKDDRLLRAFAAVHKLGEDAAACDRAVYWKFTSSKYYALPIICEDDEKMGFDGVVEGGLAVVMGYDRGAVGVDEVCRCGKIPRPRETKKPRTDGDLSKGD